MYNLFDSLFLLYEQNLIIIQFCRYGLREPDRGNLDDPAILWREGKPDYTIANYTFLKEKSQNHTQGILNYRNRPKTFCKKLFKTSILALIFFDNRVT